MYLDQTKQDLTSISNSSSSQLQCSDSFHSLAGSPLQNQESFTGFCQHTVIFLPWGMFLILLMIVTLELITDKAFILRSIHPTTGCGCPVKLVGSICFIHTKLYCYPSCLFVLRQQC
ncbi:hypothetical protein S83_069083 [Arachis hypogaea]|nr:uncharacterized protein DS421_20g681730 [Arachis hypogaea]